MDKQIANMIEQEQYINPKVAQAMQELANNGGTVSDLFALRYHLINEVGGDYIEDYTYLKDLTAVENEKRLKKTHSMPNYEEYRKAKAKLQLDKSHKHLRDIFMRAAVIYAEIYDYDKEYFSTSLRATKVYKKGTIEKLFGSYEELFYKAQQLVKGGKDEVS